MIQSCIFPMQCATSFVLASVRWVVSPLPCDLNILHAYIVSYMFLQYSAFYRSSLAGASFSLFLSPSCLTSSRYCQKSLCGSYSFRLIIFWRVFLCVVLPSTHSCSARCHHLSGASLHIIMTSFNLSLHCTHLFAANLFQYILGTALHGSLCVIFPLPSPRETSLIPWRIF